MLQHQQPACTHMRSCCCLLCCNSAPALSSPAHCLTRQPDIQVNDTQPLRCVLTSTSIPSFSNTAAASSVSPTILLKVTTVTSLPWRITLALPIGTVKSLSSTCTTQQHVQHRNKNVAPR